MYSLPCITRGFSSILKTFLSSGMPDTMKFKSLKLTLEASLILSQIFALLEISHYHVVF